MRIALVTSSFFPTIGGAEFVVHNLGCQWTLQGHDVCVINPISDKVTQPDALYTVRRYSILRGSCRIGYHHFPFQWYAVHGLKRVLKDFNPDFISAHFAYPTGLWLSRINPLPRFLVTCHGRDVTELEQGHRKRYNIDPLMTDALNKSSGAIAISTYARKLLEEMGVEPANIIDIPNGVDVDRFQKQVDFDLRARLGIPRDAIVILSIGRGRDPAKAFDTGIKAFAKLNAKVRNTYFLVVGRLTDRFHPLADELGVSKNVIFSEGLFGDELVGAYQQVDIFFSSSIRELCPLVVLEAMAAGLPAVVTNVSGSQDMIRTGTNGIVVEPGHPDEMCDALYQLVTDESLRKRFGSANLERSKSYDWSRISRMYLEHA